MQVVKPSWSTTVPRHSGKKRRTESTPDTSCSRYITPQSSFSTPGPPPGSYSTPTPRGPSVRSLAGPSTLSSSHVHEAHRGASFQPIAGSRGSGRKRPIDEVSFPQSQALPGSSKIPKHRSNAPSPASHAGPYARGHEVYQPVSSRVSLKDQKSSSSPVRNPGVPQAGTARAPRHHVDVIELTDSEDGDTQPHSVSWQ